MIPHFSFKMHVDSVNIGFDESRIKIIREDSHIIIGKQLINIIKCYNSISWMIDTGRVARMLIGNTLGGNTHERIS